MNLRTFLAAWSIAGVIACSSGKEEEGSGGAGGSSAGRGGGSSGSTTGGSGGTGGASGGSTGGSETGGTGNTGTGGTGGTGGSGGNAATGGSSGGSAGGGGSSSGSGGSAGSGGRAGSSNAGGNGGGVCCNAIPTCGIGEREIPTAQQCALLPLCKEVTLCCTTIYCDELTPGSGGSSGTGGSAGSGNGSACNAELEPDREYVGESREECMVVRFSCPENTTMFANDCGCGCEQDESCPDFVDCMPGGNPNPGCTAEERARCPYTDIAF
jgi:hypothetical protein